MSSITLRSTFFNNLWPLILDENRCNIQNQQKTEYFEPKFPFNEIRAHAFLANVGFKDYQMPIGIRCENVLAEFSANKFDKEKEAEDAEEKEEDEEDEPVYTWRKPNILPIDKQIEELKRQEEHRQKLSYDFVNRKYPWTMQIPSHEKEFEFTEELRDMFQNPFEAAILRGILTFSIRLMIIDAGTEICIDDLRRWMKFRTYVQIIVLVRCPVVARQLKLFNYIFKPLIVVENPENSWNDELNCSLRTGMKFATELGMLENCASAFVFIFSKHRGWCTCDTFKFLRKN